MKLPMFVREDGRPSFTLTACVTTLAVVLLKVLFGGSTVKSGDVNIVFSGIDAGMVAALLAPTLGSYVWRRGQDATLIDAPTEVSGSVQPTHVDPEGAKVGFKK